MRVSVNLDAEEYYIDEPDPTDRWDIGKKGIILNGVSANKSDKDYDYLLPDGTERCFVVIEHYGDGCTFGSAECMEIKGVFAKYDEAREFEKTIYTGHGYFGWHVDFLIEEVEIR